MHKCAVRGGMYGDPRNIVFRAEAKIYGEWHPVHFVFGDDYALGRIPPPWTAAAIDASTCFTD